MSVLATTSSDGELVYIDNQQSESEASNISCSAPDSEYGDALDWNIQIVSEFSDINSGQQLNDINNFKQNPKNANALANSNPFDFMNNNRSSLNVERKLNLRVYVPQQDATYTT